MKNLYFLLVFGLAFAHLQAASLSGRISDSSGAILPGATLTLHDRAGGKKWTAVSDEQGNYHFNQLTSGEYIIQASLTGFETLIEPLQLDTQSAASHDLTLQVGVLSDRVVVTATGTPQLASEAARTPYLIDSRQLDERKEAFLPEALLGVPGLRVQRARGPGSFVSIRFRGLRDADTALLVNGFQIRDAAGFRGDISGFWEDLMLANTDRIEVLAGSGSTLYGSSASGGVINVIPRLGSGPPSVEAGFEGGSLEFSQESFRSQGTLGDRFHYSLGALRTDLNAGLDGQDVFRNTTLATMLQYDLSPNIKISGIIHYLNTPRLDLNSSPFAIGPPENPLGYAFGAGPVAGFVQDLDDPDSRRQSHLFSAILNWEHRLNNFWSYSLYFQDTETSQDFSEGPQSHPFLDGLGVFEFAFDSFLIEGSSRIAGTRHYLQAGAHHLFLFGLEHQRESRSSQFVLTAPGPPATTDRQSSTAFFIQDHMQFFDRRLQLTVNFRSQFFSVDNPESVPELQNLDTPDAYTGGLAVSYLFRDWGTKLRAQAANGFRAPSLSERFSIVNFEEGPLRVGNPELSPERTLTLEAGLDQALADDRLRVGVTYFYNRLQEIITSTSLFLNTNARGGLSRGVELTAQAAASQFLSFRASYSYTRADFIAGFEVLKADNTLALGGLSRPIEGIPNHQWALGLNFRRGRWNLNADYAATSSYPEPLFAPDFPFTQVLFEFDGYDRLDLTAGYTLAAGDRSEVELYLRAENVLNDTYFEDGFRTPGAVARAGIRWRLK